MAELPPQYNPQDVEESRYAWWNEQGLFHADPDSKRTPYTIVIPPPNVTGILHMGHALNNTIQDILIRWHRMRGDNALWVPGTDHAGIATQNVVEKALAKEGKRRQDLGRDAFTQRVWQWKEQYGNTILYQLRRLGSSCDWRRTRFTMDEGLSEAVTTVFLELYQKGLIYRGSYMINWCPRCQTALADEEAPRQETQGKLYHIRYPLAEGFRLEAGGKSPRASSLEPRAVFIEVATTRPETMLGDTAIAVHPKDKRYNALIGSHAILPIVNRRLPIIADEAVDRDFGTGVVKVTPAHDPADFQLGRKHKLESIDVMTDDAHMTNVPEAYKGLDRYDCRSKLIVDLEQGGFLGAIDEHLHNVGHCYRCNTVVEPRLSPQWFVKMGPLARPAIKAVKDGTITFHPSRWTKVYLNWMENIQDWCISRQIWWGHRIPVWYCDHCALQTAVRSGMAKTRYPDTQHTGVIVSATKPALCPSCRSTDLRQDEDVLDTWFSSWLWPFSTLGWPKKTKDLACFYPTNTLVTAQEIIFFWVARMIMAGYFCMKRPPFTDVYIHGTVRDITGKKMSKSLGNIIDPLDIIKQYGTDALRYTLVTATAIGQDVFLSEERFAAGRNFANKLWNATRFVLSNVEPDTATQSRVSQELSSQAPAASIWILSRLQRTVKDVTEALERFQFNEAANRTYDFVWHDFCNWYIEVAKVLLAQGDRNQTLKVLLEVLNNSLRLLHPIMPFITEELWQHLRKSDPSMTKSIMIAPWPQAGAKIMDERTERAFGQVIGVAAAVRTLRAELNIPIQSRPDAHLIVDSDTARRFLHGQKLLIQSLAQLNQVTITTAPHRPKNAAATIVDGVEVVIPLAGLIDAGKECARLQQRVEELTKQLAGIEGRLKDPQFTTKAPADVVEQTRTRRAQVQETLKKFSDHLALLQSM